MSDKLAKRLAVYRDHPSTMVREMFEVDLDPWQEEALEAFATDRQVAMSCSKGPGKTAIEAWCAWNFLITREHPKAAACSISGDNLRDNLWTEMAKWRSRNEFLQRQFEWTATRIYARKHPETWWMSARSYKQTATSEQQANTLAGIHADSVLFVIDEAGGVADGVMVAAEAAMSTTRDCRIVIGGNPTHLSGPLYRAVKTSDRKNWRVIVVTGDPDDPRRSSRISVDWARQMIEKYGRNSAWVMVNVFGQFPLASINALIGPDEVDAAMARYWRPHEIGIAARVLGVDVAQWGDDSSVVFPRQGIQAFPFDQHRNLTSIQGAGVVARRWDAFEADACFVDNTGGFGAGWCDQLEQLGKAPIRVGFAERAHNSSQYANKRAEMAFEACQWIRNGGALPKSENLKKALVETTYTFDRGGEGMRMLLEPKELIKDRIGFSPDEFDALILTFAEPVTSRQAARRGRQASAVPANYDPFAVDSGRGRGIDEYDPFR